jgi:membrane associated rhomboid family serine protease
MSLAVACLAVHLGGWSQTASLIPGELRLQTMWTSHFAHYSWPHLATNLILLLTGCVATERVLGFIFMALMLAVGAPVIACGVMWLEPDMLEYRGFSGIATAFFFALGTWLYVYQSKYRIFLIFSGLAFAVRSILHASSSVLTVLPDNVETAWSAHMTGAITGLLLGCSALRLRRYR